MAGNVPRLSPEEYSWQRKDQEGFSGGRKKEKGADLCADSQANIPYPAVLCQLQTQDLGLGTSFPVTLHSLQYLH